MRDMRDPEQIGLHLARLRHDLSHSLSPVNLNLSQIYDSYGRGVDYPAYTDKKPPQGSMNGSSEHS